MTQSLVSGKFAHLVNKLTPAGTITLDRDIGVTTGRIYFVNDNQSEWVDFTSNTLTGSNYVLGGLTRDVSQTAIPKSSLSTGKTWLANQKVILVAMHDQIFDPTQGGTISGAVSLSSTLDVAGASTFTKSLKFPVYADATARDTAIPSPANGMVIYNTALGVLQQYIAGAWTVFASGTTVNADTTTAGKVELPTTAEVQSNTQTG